MKHFFALLVVLLFCSCETYGQSKFIDSIMAIRHTDSLTGTPKTYYTNKEKAIQFQKLFFNSSTFYGKRYHTDFSVRLAVLDSTKWTTEKLPFGFLAYDSGWVFLPSAVSASAFLSIYGISQNKSLDNFLQKKRLTLNQLSDAVYFVYSLHELGHYFTNDKENVVIPDMFANELIATYFSYCFFKMTKNPALQTLIDFSAYLKTNYHPLYRNIEAMDSLYDKMPIQNFKWFHCNIVLLCGEIYKMHGINFIDYYLNAFKKDTLNRFTTQQVIDLLDKKCNGKVSAWAKGLTDIK